MLQSRARSIALTVLLLLPVLYVFSYAALVMPAGKIVPLRSLTSKRVVIRSHYRIEGIFAGRVDTFFWPLEQIDRKLRPETWRSKFVPERKQGGAQLDSP